MSTDEYISTTCCYCRTNCGIIAHVRDGIIVKSAKGTVELKAKVTDETMAGVVIMDFDWGNPWDDKANLNALTSDDVRDKTGSTPNRRFRCEVSKA